MRTMQTRLWTLFITVMLLIPVLPALAEAPTRAKPSPDEALAKLKAGNERFMKGESIHPHIGRERLALAGSENQGDHAYATVLTCSDSRLPVELLFDAGIMDIFVIRVAGNVADTDEIGSIEYGLAHVNTPVLVVLGHTQCGAVTAVTQAVQGAELKLERNIPPLVANIQPAVERAMKNNPEVKGAEIIPAATIANVHQSVMDLFIASPKTRELVREGKVKVVGAIYDVGTGAIDWLPERRIDMILKRVEGMEDIPTNPYAGGEDDHHEHHGDHQHDHDHDGHDHD